MYVVFIAKTKGKLDDGKPWESRTAICIENNKGNEFVKVYKLVKDCDVPLPNENVSPCLMIGVVSFGSIKSTDVQAADYYNQYNTVSDVRQILGTQWDSEDSTTISYRFTMGGISPPLVSRSYDSCLFNGSNTALADMEYAVTVYDYGTNDELFRSEFVPCGTLQTLYSQPETGEPLNAYKITLRRIDGSSLTGSMMFNSAVVLSGDAEQQVYNTTAIPESWRADTTQTVTTVVQPDVITTSTIDYGFVEESMTIPPKILSLLDEIKSIFHVCGL